MSIEEQVRMRCGSACELCTATTDLEVFVVSPRVGDNADDAALLCGTCRAQINDPATIDVHHWRCLNDSMWSQVPAVQVLAYRMLTQLRSEGWPGELLDMLYLEDDILAWAQEGIAQASDNSGVTHRDSNGANLADGDNITLIKDLQVKGAGFTAKRGTMVRGISLVPDNGDQVEGRVNGQHIVILTKFTKKA